MFNGGVAIWEIERCTNASWPRDRWLETHVCYHYVSAYVTSHGLYVQIQKAYFFRNPLVRFSALTTKLLEGMLIRFYFRPIPCVTTNSVPPRLALFAEYSSLTRRGASYIRGASCILSNRAPRLPGVKKKHGATRYEPKIIINNNNIIIILLVWPSVLVN